LRYLVGIDDSDSRYGLCTTFLGYRLVTKLVEEGCRITTYPRLVRLNPNIPFKTRGNAAVCVEFESDYPDANFSTICSLVQKYSDTANGANTGLVLVESSSPMDYFRDLYERALSGVVNKDGVLRSVSALGAKVFTLGNGMGIVGASASIGFDPTQDHTFELIAYRRRERWGTARAVDGDSVRSMDRQTFPHTLNNFDYQNERVLITPHGPDPVLLGIRGDSPLVVLKAFSAVRRAEDADGYMIYVSNQHTDAHLRQPLTFPLRTFSSGWVEGRVARLEVGAGSHVYFGLEGDTEPVRCAVYQPAGDLQKTARLLRTGDLIRVAGGVRRASQRHPKIVNVERIEVKSLRKEVRSSNPTCTRCGATMKSEGRGKGFQCPKCKNRVAGVKSTREVRRLLRSGVYLPSSRSQRHLTKQLIRYGSELVGETMPLVEGWLGTDSVRLLRTPARSP